MYLKLFTWNTQKNHLLDALNYLYFQEISPRCCVHRDTSLSLMFSGCKSFRVNHNSNTSCKKLLKWYIQWENTPLMWYEWENTPLTSCTVCEAHNSSLIILLISYFCLNSLTDKHRYLLFSVHHFLNFKFNMLWNDQL